MYVAIVCVYFITILCNNVHAISMTIPKLASPFITRSTIHNKFDLNSLDGEHIESVSKGSIDEVSDSGTGIGIGTEEESSPLLKTDSRLATGTLSNGMQYKILNRYDSVRNKDEVGLYLEILAGSADESNYQRGMAHALEHILQENNPKRYLLADRGNSIHSNAFTDLHHTVYTIDNINMKSNYFDNHRMLSNSMKTLAEVFNDQQINEEVLNSEVDIIKSEASMIHSNEYRKQSAMLGVLHHENILSKRLPIGLVHTASTWTVNDLKNMHEKYYKPSNAILYIVGDLASPEKQKDVIESIEQSIDRVFGKIDGDILKTGKSKSTVLGEEKTLKSVVSTQFPPVKRHIWSVGNRYLKEVLGYPSELIGKSAGYHTNRNLGEKIVSQALTKSNRTGTSTATPPLEANEALIQLSLPTPIMLRVGISSTPDNSSSTNYECHIYAKKPIVSIKTEEDLKLFYYQRLILWLIRSRLMHHEHTIDSCKHLAFDEHEFPREGCAVNAISVVTRDVEGLYRGLRAVLQELMRIGSVTDHSSGFSTWRDVVRYARMVISETEEIQRHRQATSSNMEIAEYLMDQSASDHTIMSPDDSIDVCKKLLHFVEDDTAANTAKEMCHHICDMNITDGVTPHSIVVCAPEHSHSQICHAEASDENEISSEKVKTFITDVLKKYTPSPSNLHPTDAGANTNVDVDTTLETLPHLPVYPTPRKLFHRKNTIIRLWRMIAPQYTHPPRRKIIPVLRGGATNSHTHPHPKPKPNPIKRSASSESWSGNGFAYNQVVTAASHDMKKATRSNDPNTMTNRQLRILEYKRLVQPNYEENVEIEQNQIASNGLFVNYVSTGVEPNRIMAQLKIPGGKLAGSNSSALLMELGARMLQEGSSIGRRSLDTIQFFCLERKIQMDISLESDCLLISFSAPAKTIGVERYHRNNGLEMILHLLRGILKDYQYDKNSYNRVMKTIEREFSPTASESTGTGRRARAGNANVISLSHSSQSLDSLCRAAIRGRVAHSDARFVPLSSLTTVSNSSKAIGNINRYGVHTIDKIGNPLADIKKLMQSQLSKLQHQEYVLTLPGVMASADANANVSNILSGVPSRDNACAGVELTVAGNMTLGRMRELTVRVLGTVLSDKQMHYVENTVRPSRKMKRKLQQQKLKEEFNRRSNSSETGGVAGSSTVSTESKVSSGGTSTGISKQSKTNNRRKSGAAQKNRAMKSTKDARTYDPLGLSMRGAASDMQRFEGVRGVAWNDASNIVIEAVADGCRIVDDSPSDVGTSTPSVKHAVGFLVGPAFNKHGVLCDDSITKSMYKDKVAVTSNLRAHMNTNTPIETLARISPPVERVPYLPPISPSDPSDIDIEWESGMKPNRLSRSHIHTGTSAESLKNRKKLNKYLGRLKVIREQEEYDDNDMQYYKSHPLYVQMMTMLIEQILTNKLYASIRDEHNLAYDVTFRIHSLDSSINLPNDAISLTTSNTGSVSNTTTSLSLPGGWYEVEVMTSADKMNQALTACRHIIDGIGNEAAVVGSKSNYQSDVSIEKNSYQTPLTATTSTTATTSGIGIDVEQQRDGHKKKRIDMLNELLSQEVYQDGVIATEHIGEKDVEEAMRYIELMVKKEKFSLKYWVESLSGSQMAGLHTSLVSVDKLKILRSISLKDIQHTLCKMKFAKSEKEFSCVAVAV